MKRFFLVFFIALFIISCNSSDRKMKNSINEYLSNFAKDPSSYQLIELKIIDTITISEINKIKEENLLSQQLSILSSNFYTVDDKKIKVKDLESEISNLLEESKLSSNVIKGYVANHRFRMKNSYGGLELYSLFILFDSTFKVVSMDEIYDITKL